MIPQSRFATMNPLEFRVYEVAERRKAVTLLSEAAHPGPNRNDAVEWGAHAARVQSSPARRRPCRLPGQLTKRFEWRVGPEVPGEPPGTAGQRPALPSPSRIVPAKEWENVSQRWSKVTDQGSQKGTRNLFPHP